MTIPMLKIYPQQNHKKEHRYLEGYHYYKY